MGQHLAHSAVGVEEHQCLFTDILTGTIDRVYPAETK